MKIIVNNADNIVIFASPTLTLDSTGSADPGQWVYHGATTANATLVDNVVLPTGFTGGAYTYVSGIFTRTTGGQAIYDANIAQMKSDKNDEINAARLDANLTSFPYGGKQIACDTLSRSDIDGANGYIVNQATLPPGWPGGWKAVDNTYVAITDIATWKLFYAAMVGQGMINFAKAQTLKATLASATTPEQIEAIAW